MPTASPSNSLSTHHVLLGASGATAALILCDSRGNANEYAIRKDPMPRMSLKMYSGEPKWDDLEPPWTPVAVSEWAGGRGRKEYDVDKTRYHDGIGVDTTKSGLIVLAGQPVYITGTNKIWPYCGTTGDCAGYSEIGLSAGTRYIAQKFVAPANYTIKYVHFILKYIEGTTLNSLTVSIFSDSGGSPNAIVGAGVSASVAKTSLSEEDHWEDVYITLTNTSALVSGTTYWIVFDSSSTTDATSYWSVLGTNSAGTVVSKVSANGSSWSAGTYDAFYRTRAARAWYRKVLFEYKDQYTGPATTRATLPFI